MKRPTCWNHLPRLLRELIVEKNWAKIEYDPYESSRTESIDALLNYDLGEYDRNNKIIQSVYEKMPDEEIEALAKDGIESLETQIKNLHSFLN